MSLTESKVNYEYDDRIVDVAETDRLKFPVLQAVYSVGDEIIPEFTNETFNEWEIVLSVPEDSTVVTKLSNGHLQAIGSGKETIKMRLKNHDTDDPRKAVTREFEITVNASASEDALFIQGDDSIRLDRYAIYTLINEDTSAPVANAVTFSVQNKDEKEKIALVTSNVAYDKEDNIIEQACVLHANAKNKLGEVILSAEYNGQIYTKTIKIIPLW